MANKFSIGGFKIFSTAGTVFASLVGAPLLIFIITRFTLGGNKDAIPYADTYIKKSDTIVVQIPIDHREIDTYYDIFTTKAWFAGVAQTRTATYNLYYFFSPKYKKYLEELFRRYIGVDYAIYTLQDNQYNTLLDEIKNISPKKDSLVEIKEEQEEKEDLKNNSKIEQLFSDIIVEK